MYPSLLKSYAIVGLTALHNLANSFSSLNYSILKSYAVGGIILGNCGLLKDKDYPTLSIAVEVSSRMAGVGFMFVEQNNHTLLDATLKSSIAFSFGYYTLLHTNNPGIQLILTGSTIVGTALPFYKYGSNNITNSNSKMVTNPDNSLTYKAEFESAPELTATLVEGISTTGIHDEI